MRRVVLKSIQTNGGFLENADVSFEPALNCIIGARGTCKSTLVESIRFAFDSDLRRIEELTKSDGVIRKTLGSASVRCVVEVIEDNTTSEYVIEREVDTTPRITKNGQRDPLANDIIHEIEIYSQGALQQLASSDQPHLRLSLIDRPHRTKITAFQQNIEQTAAHLSNLGLTLRGLRTEIDKRRLAVREIDKLRAELGQTLSDRPELPPTLEQQHSQYLARQRTLELLHDLTELQGSITTSLDGSLAVAVELDAIRQRTAELATETSTIDPLIHEFQLNLTAIKSLRDNLAAIPVHDHLSEMSGLFESANVLYYEQRQQQQMLTESLKREDALRRNLAELEKSERELKQFEIQRDDLLVKRQLAREQLENSRQQIFALRVQEAERVNRQFGEVILLSVQRAALSKSYISALTDLMSGSRIRGQDDIAAELARSFTPAELLTTIEQGDAAKIAALLGRDLGQITRVITYLRDHPNLYSLEGSLADDALDITMFDQGESKSIEELSAGQRATALLPLILRTSDCPLIVDQPEDDLDNSFIYRVLVKTILTLKTVRQLVFVTHNANIPVLGDAENVTVMHMASPNKAARARAGTLEDRKADILDLLEGGKEAFENRERRYDLGSL